MSAPNDGTTIQCRVDNSQLDQIEQECFKLLYQQRMLYNERWYSSRLFARGISFLRWLGLWLSVFGAALSVFYLVFPSTCPKWFFAEAYLLFFIVSGALFYYLPRFQDRFHGRFRTMGEGSSRRLARRMVARARKQVPFEAKYEIHGDLVTYSRGLNGQWQKIWSRQARGYAVLGTNVTLLFRKHTSIIPTLLILHPDPAAMESVLKGIGLAYQRVS